MITYIKPSKNEFTDLKIIIQKDFRILLQVISTLLWMGVCFGWNFKTAKCENSIIMCVFIGSPPTIISLCHWKRERLGMKFIHSFIHSFTSSFFFEHIKNYHVLMRDHLTRCNRRPSLKCTPCVHVHCIPTSSSCHPVLELVCRCKLHKACGVLGSRNFPGPPPGTYMLWD
jgi:hypothetical protein